MLLVGVRFQLGDQLVPLRAHGADIRSVQFVEVGGVEPRAEDSALLGDARGVEGDAGAKGRVHRLLLSVKLTS